MVDEVSVAFLSHDIWFTEESVVFLSHDIWFTEESVVFLSRDWVDGAVGGVSIT